ncbi:MAG TPA: hypothetical protein VFB66_01230 [Tepidisphaeraceae bacterium]|nr:hypothetical protein [Tepidisphaeraceae bacterium]
MSQYRTSRPGRDGWLGLSDDQNFPGRSPASIVLTNDQALRRGWCSNRHGCRRSVGSSTSRQVKR